MIIVYTQQGVGCLDCFLNSILLFLSINRVLVPYTRPGQARPGQVKPGVCGVAIIKILLYFFILGDRIPYLVATIARVQYGHVYSFLKEKTSKDV